MSAIERRAEIMRILTSRRKCYLSELSDELGVSKRTIQRDIQALVLEYPLESISGNGGGIRLADWYYPHKNILSQEHIHVIEAMIEKADSHQKVVLQQMLAAFGSNTYRSKCNSKSRR